MNRLSLLFAATGNRSVTAFWCWISRRKDLSLTPSNLKTERYVQEIRRVGLWDPRLYPFLYFDAGRCCGNGRSTGTAACHHDAHRATRRTRRGRRGAGTLLRRTAGASNQSERRFPCAAGGDRLADAVPGGEPAGVAGAVWRHPFCNRAGACGGLHARGRESPPPLLRLRRRRAGPLRPPDLHRQVSPEVAAEGLLPDGQGLV